MAVILEERGRGKFKPAPDYKVDEVKELLNKKIEEERQAFADCSEEIEFDKLNYDPNKWNLLSLFSGCGGLDLGFELAGLIDWCGLIIWVYTKSLYLLYNRLRRFLILMRGDIMEIENRYVVLDVETNGLSSLRDDLLSISIYKPDDGKMYDRFYLWN